MQGFTSHFQKAGNRVGVARQLITNSSCSFEPGNLWPVDITTPASKWIKFTYLHFISNFKIKSLLPDPKVVFKKKISTKYL